MNQVANILQL